MRKDGYGKLFIERRWHLVHRVAWTDKNGPIPDSLYVCHKCDVRACVNPDHLFLGTAADNAADRDRKGRNRQPSGSRNAKAKLTEAQVYAIKRDGRSEQEIADIYQVHQTTINVILRGKTWRHVQ